MSKYIYEKTTHENIYSYKTQSGQMRYRIHISRRIDGDRFDYAKNGFKNQAQAVSKRNEVLGQIEDRDLVHNRTMTVKKYWTGFRRGRIDSKTWTPDSVSSYDNSFKKHILPEFAGTKLISLNRVTWQEFLNKLMFQKDLSVATAKTINDCMQALLNDAVINEVIPRNRLIKMVFNKKEVPKKKFLEMKQFYQAVDMAKQVLEPYHYAAFYLATIGLRRGEIMGIKRKDIEFHNIEFFAYLHIQRSRTQRVPKGKETKTPDSNRILLIKGEAYNQLKFLYDESAEQKKDVGELPHQNDYIYFNRITGKPYTPSNLNRIFNQVDENLPFHIFPHMFRHTFATQMQLAGAPEADVKQYLGHSPKSNVTAEVYTHATLEGESKMVDIMEKRYDQRTENPDVTLTTPKKKDNRNA